MSYLRFQHVFVGLMGVSALSAFVIPSGYSRRFEPSVQGLFAPVSRPAGSLAAMISSRVSPPASDDRRAAQDLREENQRLRAELSRVQTQLDEMRRVHQELSKLGDARKLCQLFKVVGADSGTRESIALGASSFDGVRDDQYVLYPFGLVGQVYRAGAGGSQVKLITDPSYRVQIAFRRLNAAGQMAEVGIPICLAQGTGSGSMVVREMNYIQIGLTADFKPPPGKENGALKVGDIAVVSDRDCPMAIQGEPIGTVVAINRRKDQRMFAEIVIKPNQPLKKLREVMVMTKE